LILQAGERSISYTLAGPESSPCIVFIHGLAASQQVWAEQATLLGDSFRVLRYDLRSHGGSSALQQACSRSDLADDMFALLDGLEIDRAVIIGHSAGGVVAMQAAVDRPSRVSALVLVGTASECNDKTAKWYAATAESARRAGGETAMKAMGMRRDSGPAPDGGGFAHVALAMHTLNQDPLTEALRSVDIPTLLVVGEKDFLGVGGSVILSRAIADSELEIVPERGHGVYLEDPAWFAERVKRFLAARVAGL